MYKIIISIIILNKIWNINVKTIENYNTISIWIYNNLLNTKNYYNI